MICFGVYVQQTLWSHFLWSKIEQSYFNCYVTFYYNQMTEILQLKVVKYLTGLFITTHFRSV